MIRHAFKCKCQHLEKNNGRLITRCAPPDLFLLSNGLIMNNEILQLCRECNINLSLSLPGLTTFAEHTGAADPRKVLKWFQKASDEGVTTTAGITVTARNIGELYETISEALLAGADTLLLNRFLPGGRGLDYAEDLMLNEEQITTMLDTAEEVLRLADRRGSVGTELPKCLVDMGKYTHLEVGTDCSAAIAFFVIGPSGHVRVCNHSPLRLNHIDEVDKIKHHPYWKRFVSKDYLPSSCNGCVHALHCDGGCREAAHVITGAPDGIDPALDTTNQAE